MACWLCCLLVACCLSLYAAPITACSQALLGGKVANEPDPDSAELGFSFVALETKSETALHEEERPTKFTELEEKLISSFISESESTELGPALHDEESSIASLLNQNGLPIGLLPSCVESYTLSDAGQFSVSLEKACYVTFDYEVYYAQTITGTLSYGSIADLSGIQAKKAFIWLPVTGIRTDASSSSYIYFDVGPISKRLSISQFQAIPLCKANAMDFRSSHALFQPNFSNSKLFFLHLSVIKDIQLLLPFS